MTRLAHLVVMAFDAFNESDHPRAGDGKFGGGGSKGPGKKKGSYFAADIDGKIIAEYHSSVGHKEASARATELAKRHGKDVHVTHRDEDGKLVNNVGKATKFGYVKRIKD